MSTSHSPTTPKIRRGRWTPECQLRFLDALARTRNVGQAAASAGMSRESAHRLRNRTGHALFATLWDRALAPEWVLSEGHNESFSDGRLARLLGTHFRRESGTSWPSGRSGR
jgi:hypothetical protein